MSHGDKLLTGTFAARWIVPMCRRPIRGGWIRFCEGVIDQIHSGSAPRGAVDLGDVALLPGLVNCHTHLEFSDLSQPLGQPGNALPAWIAAIVRHRLQQAQQPAGDARQRRFDAIAAGYQESLEAGVRLLGEIVTLPWPDRLEDARLEVVAFVETLGLLGPRAEQTYRAAIEWLDTPRQDVQRGISPHAPYSTSEPLLEDCLQLARRRNLPVAMHVAESPEELELVSQGSGAFRDALMELGVWREGLFPRVGGIDGILQKLATAPRALVVHGNYLTDSQIAFLAQQPHTSVIFCPRTHHYFRHAPYPLAKMLAAGVRVALGTDSRGSNPDLRLWNEVRHAVATIPEVPVEDVLKMATLWGAQALGRPDCGRLAPGCRPGLLMVPARADTPEQLWQAIAAAAAPSMVGQ